ncbi:MAG: hypothetical protein RL385_2976 [Pseudomonadota bacterium]
MRGGGQRFTPPRQRRRATEHKSSVFETAAYVHVPPSVCDAGRGRARRAHAYDEPPVVLDQGSHQFEAIAFTVHDVITRGLAERCLAFVHPTAPSTPLVKWVLVQLLVLTLLGYTQLAPRLRLEMQSAQRSSKRVVYKKKTYVEETTLPGASPLQSPQPFARAASRECQLDRVVDCEHIPAGLSAPRRLLLMRAEHVAGLNRIAI